MAESLSVSVGECVATFVDPLTGESLVFGGDTFYNADDLLGEIQFDEPRIDRHMASSGLNDVVMQNLSRAGKRSVTFLLGADFDRLKSWGQRRIQPIFNFDFYFKYNTQSAEGARIQRHKRCGFEDSPLQGIGRKRGYVTVNISFGDVAEINPATGQEI